MWTAAIILIAIGAAHSVLGERVVLRPLLANPDWRIRVFPRGQSDRLLRLCWHLTTVAWWGMAAVLMGAPVVLAFAAISLSAGVAFLWVLPGHLSWPFFLAAGLLALWTADALPTWLLWVGVGAGVAVALVVAAFHVSWAFGSRIGTTNVVPQRPGTGERTFVPGPVPTLAVAALLTTYAVLAIASVTSASAVWIGWLLVAGMAVLLLRVVGDGKWMGVTKRVRGTGFADADDRWWTPAAAVLALGAASALVLG